MRKKKKKGWFLCKDLCPVGYKDCGFGTCALDVKGNSCNKNLLKKGLKIGLGVAKVVLFFTTLGAGKYIEDAAEWGVGLLGHVVLEVPEAANDIATWAIDLTSAAMDSFNYIKGVLGNNQALESAMKKCARRCLDLDKNGKYKMDEQAWQTECTKQYQKHFKKESIGNLKNLIPGAAMLEKFGSCFKILKAKQADEKKREKDQCKDGFKELAATLDPTGIIALGSELSIEKCNYD